MGVSASCTLQGACKVEASDEKRTVSAACWRIGCSDWPGPAVQARTNRHRPDQHSIECDVTGLSRMVSTSANACAAFRRPAAISALISITPCACSCAARSDFAHALVDQPNELRCLGEYSRIEERTLHWNGGRRRTLTPAGNDRIDFHTPKRLEAACRFDQDPASTRRLYPISRRHSV